VWVLVQKSRLVGGRSEVVVVVVVIMKGWGRDKARHG
jgi:hypothetical protein